MEEQDNAAITEAISETERLGLSSKLRHDVLAARNAISRRERTAQSKQPSILDFGKLTISEIRSYDHPPRIVHRVIQAALMLLGESENDTSVSRLHSDWKLEYCSGWKFEYTSVVLVPGNIWENINGS